MNEWCALFFFLLWIFCVFGAIRLVSNSGVKENHE